jgi:hypothetical protein
MDSDLKTAYGSKLPDAWRKAIIEQVGSKLDAAFQADQTFFNTCAADPSIHAAWKIILSQIARMHYLLASLFG